MQLTWSIWMILTGCISKVEEPDTIQVPPLDFRRDGDADADTDTDTDADADTDTDTDTDTDADITPTDLSGNLHYTVATADEDIVCDLMYAITGTPYTGPCEDCSFAFEMSSEFTSGEEDVGCPSTLDLRYLFLEDGGLSDFFLAHSNMLTGATGAPLFEVYYETYYDVLFIGYTHSSGSQQIRPIARNGESSSSTPLGVYGESGVFGWRDDELEWTWSWGYGGSTQWTINGRVAITGP